MYELAHELAPQVDIIEARRRVARAFQAYPRMSYTVDQADNGRRELPVTIQERWPSFNPGKGTSPPHINFDVIDMRIPFDLTVREIESLIGVITKFAA